MGGCGTDIEDEEDDGDGDVGILCGKAAEGGGCGRVGRAGGVMGGGRL